jgi:hypothetical protein
LDLVNQCIKERNEKVAENRNLIIELDPEIAAAFAKSINISSKLVINLILSCSA